MAIIISPGIAKKLAEKHGVRPEEVGQCFANRTGKYLLDTRAKHLTNPITRWFISETDQGRKLKVAFIPEGGDTFIRSAFEPDTNEISIYSKYGT
ncbi:MAG: hypothetical protein FD157_1991 [Rhodocyclaceae bacterium]|nr:MAG: hypothetical protein FD157_1991 [Rhodocyclaceae bacterium]TND00931.1 MAG: hypothetical protein FD118_2721 [Rhodocyclaceae bacterium]